MTKDAFLELLRDLVERIEKDDSLEGRIEYEAGERHHFNVLGAYRIGNSEGQGGWRTFSPRTPE